MPANPKEHLDKSREICYFDIMKKTHIKRLILIVIFIPTSLAAFKLASAQCGASFTSCYICHNANDEMPVIYKEDWHRDHSFGYLCDFCHGGDIRSMIKDEAHKDMIANPLKYTKITCEPCHADYKDRVKKYEPISKENGREENKTPVEKKQQEKEDSGLLQE